MTLQSAATLLLLVRCTESLDTLGFLGIDPATVFKAGNTIMVMFGASTFDTYSEVPKLKRMKALLSY